MKIEKIDPNFKKAEQKCADTVSYTIPCEGFELYGVSYDKKLGKFTRMDMDIAEKVSDGVKILATNTSGGRLRFSTDAKHIGISVTYPWLTQMSHMPLTGSCGFVLLEKVGKTYKNIATFRPSCEDTAGYSGSVEVGGGKREYLLFFPLYNDVSSFEIILDSSAQLFEPEKYKETEPILYYGASIDQGGCASRPDSSYPAIISKWNDIDFINLGFSGNCMGEQLMAEYLAKIDCSLFFMSYDGNAPTVEFLQQTHYPFYETYRRRRKDVPIVLMSVPCFEKYPNAAENREVLRQTYLKARENGDENIYFIDGETLFAEADREICTVEGIHPNDLGFYRMAEAIYKVFGEIGL